MAKINDTTTFPNTTPTVDDYCIGTDVSDTGNSANGEVVTFKFGDILALATSGVGDGQSWQSVTRSVATSYQNTNGRPISVSISVACSTDGGGDADAILQLSSDGSTWVNVAQTQVLTKRTTLTAIVPDNHYYKVINNGPGGSVTIYFAAELK